MKTHTFVDYIYIFVEYIYILIAYCVPDMMLTLKHRKNNGKDGNILFMDCFYFISFQTFPNSVASTKDKREYELDASNRNELIMSKRLESSPEHMVSINMSKLIIWKKSLIEPLKYGKKALFIDCILKADAWSTFPRNK